MHKLISDASENNFNATSAQLLQDVREFGYALENTDIDAFSEQAVRKLLREKRDSLARVLDAKMQRARHH